MQSQENNNKLQLTNQQHTSITLWKDSNAATVALLKDNKFDALAKAVPNKIAELLDCEPIESLIRNAGEQTVLAFVEAELIKLAANVNVDQRLNLKDYQVPVIAEHLMTNYKWESIEDFTLCFRRASCGFYGEIFRLDAAVIGTWMAKYLEEKYDALEQRKAKEKHAEKEALKLNVDEDGDKCVIGPDGKKHKIVDGTNYLKQILSNLGVEPEEDKTNAKENAYQREKLANPYKYFKVRNLQIMATSQEHAEQLVELMIKRGDLIEGEWDTSDYLKA